MRTLADRAWLAALPIAVLSAEPSGFFCAAHRERRWDSARVDDGCAMNAVR
jgi:hypothetical protein